MDGNTAGRLVWVLDADSSAFTRKLGLSRGEIKAIGNQTQDTEKTINTSFTNMIKRSAELAVVYIGIREGFKATIGAAFDQTRQVQNATFALRAYETDASKVNLVLKDLVAFARSDMGTLFQRQDLFAAAQRLKEMGVQTANLSAGTQIMARAVALGTTNFQDLADILTAVQAEGGISIVRFQQLQRAGINLDSSFINTKISAEGLLDVISKVLPVGVLEGRAKTIDGIMIKLKTSFRDVGAAILGVDKDTSQFVAGGLGDQILGAVGRITNGAKQMANIIRETISITEAAVSPLVNILQSTLVPIFDWIGSNGRLVISVIAGLGGAFLVLQAASLLGSIAMGIADAATIAYAAASISASGGNIAFAGTTTAATIAVAIFNAALAPEYLLLLAIGALMGGVVFKAFGKLTKEISSTTNNTQKLSDVIKDPLPANADKATKAMEKMGEQLAKIDEQIIKANRDFREQMAEIVKSHEDKVKDIEKQLDEENQAFKDSNDQKIRDFNSAQDNETKTHEQKIASLEQQLNNYLRFGKTTDQKKLTELRNQINFENLEYQKQAKLKNDELQTDLNKTQQAHLTKTSELQTQLDQETSILQAHAADVASIRDVQLLDDIAKLKRSHAEQLADYEKQKNDIRKNADDTAQGVINAFNAKKGDAALAGSSLGTAIGDEMIKAIKDSVKEIGRSMLAPFKSLNDALSKGGNKISNAINALDKWINPGQSEWKSLEDIRAGRALGGQVIKDQTYVVGERGPEIFKPGASGQIISNSSLNSSMNQQPVYNITIPINMQGVMTSSRSGLRDVARDLVESLNEQLRARGVQEIGNGNL